MAYWFRAQPRLTSITLRRPGLFALFFRRTYLVSLASTIFHVGMVVALLTGLIMEVLYLTGIGGVFRGGGWGLTWVHGIFGLLLVVGLVGVVLRFAINPFFRLASGRMFYVDAAFLTVISVSGLVLLGQIWGLLRPTTTWWSLIHLVSVLAWLIVSLFFHGKVAHAVATLVYRFTRQRTPAAFRAFSDACSGCGKCVEICPAYLGSAGKPEEAPALKVRRYMRALAKGAPPAEAKQMAEAVYTCSLCGLCTAACPYSFRHYDLYMTMLKQADQLTKGGRATL